MAYQCEECGGSFPRLSQLLQHRRTENHWKKYVCTVCKKVFNRKQNLERHQKKHESVNSHLCPDCLKPFISEDALSRHIEQHHVQLGGARKRSANDGVIGDRNKQRKLQEQEDMADFVIEQVGEKKIEKFRTTATYYKISVKDTEVRDLPNILKYLKSLFQSIIDRLVVDIPSNDLIRLSMDNPELDYPIVLRFMRRSELTTERLLSEIERVLQSYEQFVIDETFGIELVHVHAVVGSGYKMKPCVDISKMLENKKSIIQIRNDDHLCCARAIVTAIARQENHPQWNNIRQGRLVQKELAVQLHERAGVPEGQCGIDAVKMFQSVLPDYQINILSKEHFNGIVYSGPEGGTPIYLYQHDRHYDVITKITGFLNRNYFCLECKKGYQNKERHSCNNPCFFCRQLHADKEENWQYCEKCNCKFVNQTCLNFHLKKTETGKSTCELYYKCEQCSQIINRSKHKRVHVCGETFCKTCKDYCGEGHQCYMQQAEDDSSTVSDKRKQRETKYIFFDFECTQDTQTVCEAGFLPGANDRCVNCKTSWCGSMEHKPNMCVAHKVCSICMNEKVSPTSECVKCGSNERVFSGPDTITSFCQWLFSEQNSNSTVICHNFKGYDSYPILRYLHANAILPEVITTGSKYMSITVPSCKVRLIDSINFIPMALENMPSAFGETEIAKGYFPHLFNRQENQSAALSHLPDIKYYNPDSMKPEKRSKFENWYLEHTDDPFDLQKELLRYCRSDVDILRKCCLKFRRLFMDLTNKNDMNGIDPFQKCITIASACNLVFRTLFLDPETIGIIPPHGYRPIEKQSTMAYQWLSYLAHKQNINIQHGKNAGEKRIGPYKIDGYYETQGGEKCALEFHGCFWHGCPKCYSQNTVNPVCEATMSELYSRTREKQKYIEAEGYTYMAMWECDFKIKLETNENMRKYIDSLETVTPLEPRDAFYGGRTEAFKMYDESTLDKQIKYYDVTSLYPFINKTGKIPMGHPEIITENFQEIGHYEGLVKCKIVPPRNLYTPVLPVKCNGKLLFSLCRTCGENYRQSKCEHDEQERAFTGTWVTDEVKMALNEGYELLHIYEIWHFPEISQYDSNTRSGGLFTDYVNTFLKVKQEASGWPDWCTDEAKKTLYIQQYFDREGIWLEYNNIKGNSGLRSLAKLMLNSFWGKFGQRTNLTKTSFIDDPEVFMDMMTSDQQEVKNVRFVNEQAVQVDWVHNSDFLNPSCRTNVVIAAYTTAQARLKLYSYLKPLGERVLYCDTDSIVFTTRSGEWEPPLGDYLGDLTDEVSQNSISQFVTGGPKNYAYTLSKPNKKGEISICKVRGITLTFKNALDINFNTFKRMVTGRSETASVTVVDKNKIVRNPETCTILTKTESKDYRIVFDKRVITMDFRTIPYGM